MTCLIYDQTLNVFIINFYARIRDVGHCELSIWTELLINSIFLVIFLDDGNV